MSASAMHPVVMCHCIVFCIVCLCGCLRAADRPNILFLFADDLRADAIGPYGSKSARTPNLDRLALEGMVFTEAHIMGGDQGAVCVPSRAMLMSGRPLFRVDAALKDTPTWPMQLRAAGYRTHMTGKWHNGAASCAGSFPGARSVFFGGMSDQFSVRIADLGPDGKVVNQHTAGRHSSEVFADEAIRFLREEQNAPWALYVAFTAPHDPRQAPEEFRDRFKPADTPLPGNFLPVHPFDNGELVIRDEQLEKTPRTPDAVRRHLADYDAIISHMDAQIGRIFDTLRDIGQEQNTVIIFAADNGLAIGSHGLMGKQSVYEHSVRVPVIVRAPGVKPGSRTPALCWTIDLCSTICSLAGAVPPEGCEGLSFVPVLRGEKSTHRSHLWCAYRHLMRAVRDDRWKLIHTRTGDRWQFFDLLNDPGEITDLSGTPEHVARIAQMKLLLEEIPAREKPPADKPHQ